MNVVTLNVAVDDADCDVLVDVEPLRVRRLLTVFGVERVFDRELVVVCDADLLLDQVMVSLGLVEADEDELPLVLGVVLKLCVEECVADKVCVPVGVVV